MARQTRAERRARRQAASGGELAIAGAGGRGAEPPQPPARPEREPHRVPGGGVIGFIRESIGELRKVEWPGQNQVIQGTVVVLIACAIIGSYLYLADQVFRRFVENVLLGQ
jgi:preprotein translocase SecE subunit